MPRTATPSTCCCSPRTRRRPSSSAPPAFDLADRLQTPIFVMLDLDIGMNHRLCRPLAWDDSRNYDRGKVMTADGAGSRQGIRPLSRRRRRRHPLPHLSRHASDQGLVLHPRHLARPLCALHRGRRAPTSTTCSGCCASSTPPRTWCRARCRRNADKPTKYGVIYYGSTSPAMDEAIDMLEAARPCARPAAGPRLPVPFERRRASSPTTISSSWSSRTATRNCAR